MKVPLRFQVTEFDCGTVSLLNCFSFLFNREQIPAELVRAIHVYTLDSYDENGNLGAGGTSAKAINNLSHWITRYSAEKDFNVRCEMLSKNEISLEKFKDCLNDNGCIFLRVWQSVGHYVIITKIDNKYAYIFDPYYLPKNYYKKNKNVKIVLSHPFEYNRIVNLKRVFSETKNDFSLGEIDLRECVLINRIEGK